MKWLKDVLPWKRKKDCCSFWPDGNWQDICCQHDVDYRKNPDNLTRLEADLDLKAGVEASGHPVMAQVMFCGVRLLGCIPFYKNKLLGRHDE